ncbi:restriction endonuclease subunit S [Aromatoleum buckelii]|uniref:Restriction endonuclease subunit S n=1 Tax=Aromatoleum buckelii TaxID=200254 RepID=A0ABX1N0S1_9RHOO|nr:restriction endonuclease subunit S [Aromatoleum buckelii]MCK0510922.1 restriction endonuclease subunit S [Aromatoleum buckelii]
MSSDWPWTRLGDLLEIKHGWPFKSEYFTVSADDLALPIVVAIGNFEYTGGFRFDQTQVKRYSHTFPADYALQPGDILLVMTCQTAGGEILGIPACVPNDGRIYLHNQRLGKVALKTELVSRDFLYWLFLYTEFNRHLVNSASGTKILHTAPSRIESFRFRLPSLPEQRGIAQFLDAIANRIALLRETNATLEAIAQALFKSWFVDFDPVRAKQQGLAPERMDEATAALFPDAFEETELGAGPSGWRIGTLGEVVETAGGGTPDTKDPSYWEPPEYCWTTPKDLSGNSAPVLLGTERKLSRQGLSKVSSGLLPVGTLLMSSRAPIGYLAIAQVPLAINQGYIAMLPQSTLPPLFLLFWCRQNMENIKGRANGSTFMEISKKAFRPISVLVPSPQVIAAFINITATLFDRLTQNERQAQTLATLRDTLLPRLISGRLRLPEVADEN